MLGYHSANMILAGNKNKNVLILHGVVSLGTVGCGV